MLDENKEMPLKKKEEETDPRGVFGRSNPKRKTWSNSLMSTLRLADQGDARCADAARPATGHWSSHGRDDPPRPKC